ncbi:MAG: GIY-YIG nuclease family protein [Candidatus Heimdallarchaeota archaeon]|nr:GIY-YIG nuclease family protein [Candidatus Heimdallarchaeota archaeon]
MNFFVYMVTCADGTIYTGYTKDLMKRIEQHNSSKIGAKYTSTRRPVKLCYVEILSNQKEAIKRELELKKLSREMKLDLIHEYRNNQFEEF